MEKMAQTKESVNRAFSYGVREGPSPGGGTRTEQWQQDNQADSGAERSIQSELQGQGLGMYPE